MDGGEIYEAKVGQATTKPLVMASTTLLQGQAREIEPAGGVDNKHMAGPKLPSGKMELVGRQFSSPLLNSTFYRRLLRIRGVIQHGTQPWRKDALHRQGSEVPSIKLCSEHTHVHPGHF